MSERLRVVGDWPSFRFLFIYFLICLVFFLKSLNTTHRQFVTIVVMGLRSIMLMVIVNYALPLEYTYLGEVLSGLVGGTANFLMAAFSGAADMSTLANRVWKVSLMESSLFTGDIVGALIQGFAV